VLLVEDGDDAREIHAWCMRATGWYVQAASNALDAIEHAVASVPDVIVMDLRMPALSGIEATRLLKNNARTEHIPVIAWTAFWEGDDAAMFDGLVQKPCEPEELIAYIERFLVERES
jgi:CheY-like chemotaxis protein